MYCLNTVCPPSDHNNSFMVNGALEHTLPECAQVQQLP